MRRRLFAWFGVAIFCTASVAWLFAWGGGHTGWKRQREGAEAFIARRFGAIWDDAEARRDLAEDLAHDFDLRLRLLDRGGGSLGNYGTAECEPDHRLTIVDASGESIGRVEFCSRYEGPGPGALLGLVAGAMVLWLASGFIAWRLTKPLAQLVRVARDIGDGKLESRLEVGRGMTDDFQVLADAVNDMAARIAKQLSDQRELLAAVSHEIRTPLGHVRVLLEMMRDGADDARRVRLVDELEREVLAIDALVDRLLASSRLEFGTIDRRSLDGVSLAIRALERAGLEPTLLQAEVADARFEGDAALILQALANLLRNAAEHGGGPTGLLVSGDADMVEFSVCDEGPGFPAGSLQRVFESFRRERAELADHGSLGLGLALVRRIAQAHGGRAWARNRDGREHGAEVGFTVRRRAG